MRRSKLRSLRPVRLGVFGLGVFGLGGLCRLGLCWLGPVVCRGHGLFGDGLGCCFGSLGFCLGSFFGSFLAGLVAIGRE
jgi:hypothetical protein